MLEAQLSGAELSALCREAEARTRIPARHFHKDYWITHVLRALTSEMGEAFLFKGGTSLSKAYGLIHRFSEDIDLLILTDPSDPDEVDRVLDQIRDTAVAALGSTGAIDSDEREPGLGANVRLKFEAPARMPKVKYMSTAIRLEPGVRGGPKPHETRPIRPMLANPMEAELGANRDMQPFDVTVLHPARTLVEKVFAVHDLAERMIADPAMRPTGRQGRHFYDIHQLLDPTAGVIDAISDKAGFTEILKDCQHVTQTWYGKAADLPDSLADSPAFTNTEVVERLRPEYEQACADLCYPTATIPSWGEVLERVGTSHELLSR